MPNNAPDTIDFSHINTAWVRRHFEQAESYRDNDNIDEAIRNINALETKLYLSYGVLDTARVMIVLHEINKNMKENFSFDFLMTLLLIAILPLIELPLKHILKQLHAYQTYLYNEKIIVLRGKHEADIEKINDCMSRSSECFNQAQEFSTQVGYFSYDTLMLHVAAAMGKLRANNNATTGLNETVRSILNTNVDPNYVLPSKSQTSITIVTFYAMTNNWNAVTELLDICPNLDITICPREGILKGQSVFAFCAINNKWDLFERLLGNYNPDLNLCMEGEYDKIRDSECKGKTVTWVAARAGKSQIVCALINKGAVINNECLKKLITRCDISAIEFGIQKEVFSKQQAIGIFNYCDFTVPLLNVIVELDFWEQLKSAVNDAQMSDNDAIEIWSTFHNKFGDARYANLSKLINNNKAKNRIVLRLQQEVKDNQIVRTLLKYNTNIIRTFMNLGSDKLHNMFDPISCLPAIIDPVYIKDVNPTTLSLYERNTITRWINDQYAKDQAVGSLLHSKTDHPETRAKIDLNNLTDLNVEEKAELAMRVEKILDELQSEHRNRRKKVKIRVV